MCTTNRYLGHETKRSHSNITVQRTPSPTHSLDPSPAICLKFSRWPVIYWVTIEQIPLARETWYRGREHARIIYYTGQWPPVPHSQPGSQNHEQTTITWTRQAVSAPMQNDEVTHWHQESSWRKIIPARLYRRLTNDRTKLFANSSPHHQRTNSSRSLTTTSHIQRFKVRNHLYLLTLPLLSSSPPVNDIVAISSSPTHRSANAN